MVKKTIKIDAPNCGITQLKCEHIIAAGMSNGEKLLKPIDAFFYCVNQCKGLKVITGGK